MSFVCRNLTIAFFHVKWKDGRYAQIAFREASQAISAYTMAVIVLFLGSWQLCVFDEQATLALVMFAWLNSVTLLYGYGPTLGTEGQLQSFDTVGGRIGRWSHTSHQCRCIPSAG